MKHATTNSTEMTRIKALIMGESGIGKTRSLGTLPQDRTVIICNERGTLSLRDASMPVIVPECWDDVREIMAAWANATGDPLTATIGGQEYSASTWCIDSIYTIVLLAMAEIKSVDRAALLAERKKGEKPAGIYAEQLTQEDYGLLKARLTEFFSVLAWLPANVIVTSLCSHREDENTHTRHITPAIAGSTAFECPQWFDLVCYMKRDQDRRVWQTYNDGVVIAKDSSGALEPLEEPNWTQVFKKILASKATPKDDK